MAILSATSSVPVTSVDLEQVSILTSSPVSTTTDEVGRGSMYDMTDLAAGRLFHVHRSEEAFLLSYATSWKAATPAANAPGVFSAKTAFTRPTFWWVNPGATGATMGANSGSNTAPGLLYPQGDAALRVSAATSMGDMIVYLGWHKGGSFLAIYRVAKGHTQLVSTKWLTPIINADEDEVKWDRGITRFFGYLLVAGANADGDLYMMKTSTGVPADQRSAVGGVGQTYLNGKGFQLLPGEADPIRDTNGTIITSEGNVSFAHYRDQLYMSVVVDGGTTWNAKFYRAVHPSHGWHAVPAPTVILGPKTVAANLCGAFFQDALTPNADHAQLSSAANRGGIVYTYTVESATALRTTWGILPVPLGEL